MTSETVTRLNIINFHCQSCERTIRGVLERFKPPPTSIFTSIPDHLVTVIHGHDLTSTTIHESLVNEGFIIHGYTPRESIHRLKFLRSHPSERQRKLHIQHCHLCKEQGVGSKSSKSTPDTISLEPSKEKMPITDISKELIEVKVEKAEDINRHAQRIYLSIGGMTCASCVGTVTEKIEEISGTSEVAVDLLGKSACVVIAREELAAIVVEMVEDIGFEAELVSSEPLLAASLPSDTHALLRVEFDIPGISSSNLADIEAAMQSIGPVRLVDVDRLTHLAVVELENENDLPAVMKAIEATGNIATVIHATHTVSSVSPVTRIVSLVVDGITDSYSPSKIVEVFGTLGDAVHLEKEPTLNDPTLRVSYIPNAPTFTIRDIVQKIELIDPIWTVSIFHPPSLEQRASRMRRREQRLLLVRMAFTFIVAIPTFFLGIVFMSLVKKTNTTRLYMEEYMWAGTSTRAEWALFFLATPIMFFGADIFHRRAAHELYVLWKKGSTTPIFRRLTRFGSMNLLVSLGVSIAYFASVALLAIAAKQPAKSMDTRTPGDNMSTYFDSVVFLTLFILAGRYLEAYSKSKTADAVNILGKLRPDKALLVTNGRYSEKTADARKNSEGSRVGETVQTVSVDMLEIGDVVRVLPGSSPPSDGKLVSEEDTTFDESSLTGESKPITKRRGDDVFVGTINQRKPIAVQICRTNGESMLDQILQLVRRGATKRAPVERIADRITAYFVPVITLTASCTWIVWLSLGLSGVLPASYRDNTAGGWPLWSLEFAIAVFLIACPCGIALAAPTALFVGSGIAAKHGILARGGGEAFQEASQVDVIVFDKTGTLTEGGQPQVSDVDLCEDLVGEKLNAFGIALALESNSSHPLATAIRAFCEERDAVAVSVSEVEESPGRGLKAVAYSKSSEEKSSVLIGNETWMAEHGVSIQEGKKNVLDSWKAQGKSIALLGIDSTRGGKGYKLSAMFAVEDPIRKEAFAVVHEIQKQGIATWMISGDNDITAKAVAASVGIPLENVIAGVLPQEKAEKIEYLQRSQTRRRATKWALPWGDKHQNRPIVAMVGDGINDAPALTSADIGIAIGSGSDIAINSAKFILLTSDLRCLMTLIDLSRVVLNRVKFNFFWAFVYNMIGLPVAAGVIYPLPGHYRLSPVWASLAMALSSISVVCSSLLLKLYKEPAFVKKR